MNTVASSAQASSSSLLPGILAALDECGFSTVGSVAIPARAPLYAPPPSSLHPVVKALLRTHHPLGLYSHQSRALEANLAGRDLCVATPTASGKSLIFQSTAAHAVLTDPSARALVLYPARALVQDQSAKWTDFLFPLGLSHSFIDGGVPTAQRVALLRQHRIVLMTPDVAHAWLLARQHDEVVKNFLAHLALVVLDEAHVYDGVFGTNMAYFIRRLQVSSGPHRLIAATATIADPASFLRTLTGREVTAFDAADDGASAPQRTIVHAVGGDARLGSYGRLIAALARGPERFLAFADSRKMVETLTAEALRHGGHNPDDPSHPLTFSDPGRDVAGRVLPYRAGLESEDRTAIQSALATGRLGGVVATSAMELGVDIGEINLVVCLGVPPSMRAFRQRMGRAGRRSESVCVLVDSDGTMGTDAHALPRYLARPIEPAWLYLQNRYLQYAAALCSAAEARVHGHGADHYAYADLPATFRDLLDNELDPQAGIADDLYPLKQRGESDPHHEFPIRRGCEKNFAIEDTRQTGLGNVSFSQMLREAYPGAIYHYLARGHRITRLDARNGKIVARPDSFASTRPVHQSMVFPSFDGVLALRLGVTGFVAEAPVQVSHRVQGFVEQRGGRKTEHLYGPQSPWHAREITHFYATTGVCWYFGDRVTATERIASWIHQSFCETIGVREADVGIGLFHAKTSPLGAGVCQGVCIFDTAHGSLRLTQQLAERFDDVLTRAIERATMDGDADDLRALEALRTSLAGTTHRTVTPDADGRPLIVDTETEFADVIQGGEQAMLVTAEGCREVTVIGYRYTPRGGMYDLVHEQPGVRWQVPSANVQPIHGVTQVRRINLVTGEPVEGDCRTAA